MTTALTISSPDTRAVQSLAASIQRVVGELCNVRSSGGIIYPPVHELSFCPYNQDYLMMIEWAAWRMGRFPVARLLQRDVVLQASAACGYEIRTSKNGRLYWIIRITRNGECGEIAASLPPPAPLCLDAVPPEMGWPVPIGMTNDGELWRDLPAMGHALIVGATGAGKSNWLHGALASLFTLVGPDDLQAVIIDPKRSDMSPWANAPHLISEIAYTNEQAQKALADLAAECDRRGDLLASVGARDIVGYNKRTDKPLPLALCVIDEVLDYAADRLICEAMKTIARRGRSAGVILWVATQHAAAIAGLPRVVNVNLAARLVFRVADESAARCAGASGAERIPQGQPGRCIAVGPG